MRLTIGAMFVWVFFENWRKGLYTPAGYASLIHDYIENGDAPGVWKSVMALAATHASMAAPLQAPHAEFLAGLMVLIAIGYLAKRRAALLWSSLVLTGGVLLVSPTAYPWYFTSSIPFLCFYPSAAWLLMSVTSVLAFTPPIADGVGNSLVMLLLEYGPVYLWLAYYCWSPHGTTRSAGSQEVALSVLGVQRYLAK